MALFGRNSWLPDQDSFLRLLVDIHGPYDWNRIAFLLNSNFSNNSKSGKKCRERWKYSLCPGIKKAEWTEQEKQIVFKLHQLYANNWSLISKRLDGRTDSSIKNLFYCELKKAINKYNETHKGNSRIQRTRKSLIKDKEITKVLNMATEEETSPENEGDKSLKSFDTASRVDDLSKNK